MCVFVYFIIYLLTYLCWFVNWHIIRREIHLLVPLWDEPQCELVCVGHHKVCTAGQSRSSQSCTLLSTNLYFIKHKPVVCLFLLLMQLLPSFVLSVNFVYILQWKMYLFLAANSHAVLLLGCAYIPPSWSSLPGWYLGQCHLICCLLSVLDSFYNRAF